MLGHIYMEILVLILIFQYIGKDAYSTELIS